MSQACPKPEELVTLLGSRAGAEELRRHVAGCGACQQTLATLEEPFDALVPAAELPADPAALRRIRAAVLAGPGQAAWARTALHRLLLGGVLGVLLTALPAWLWSEWLHHPLRFPGRGLMLALFPLPLLAALRLGRRGRLSVLMAAFGLAALLALWDTAGAVVPLLRGLSCLLLTASGVVLPAALLWLFSGPERRSVLGGALVGAASWVGGLALQTAVCTLGGAAHVAAVHLGPLLLGTMSFALLGWRAAPRQPAASVPGRARTAP